MTRTKREWLDPLIEEHALITHQTALIRKELTRSPQKISEGIALRQIDKLETRISKHFSHEERSLYRELKLALKRNSPTDQMIADHESMRREFDMLRYDCKKYEAGHGSISAVRQRLDSLQRKLSNHMKKEERVLYWLAEVKLNQ